MRRKEELPDCPIATTVSLIGSKWKLLIIRNLMDGPWRFNALMKALDDEDSDFVVLVIAVESNKTEKDKSGNEEE